MAQPKVSVILPVGENEILLAATLDSLLAQTCPDFEILCPCTHVPDILNAYGEKDSRIRVATEGFSCTGAAANRGLELAQGEYVMILQPGDVAVPELLERTLARAYENRVDILAFCGFSHSRAAAEKKEEADGYNRKLIGDQLKVFSREDYPSCFLSVLNSILSFRLTKISILREHNIHFQELPTQWQLSFCALCDAHADRIGLMDWRLLTIPAPDSRVDAGNVLTAADRTAELLHTLPSGKQATLRLLVEFTTAAFRRAAADFGSAEARMLYDGLQSRYTSALFAGLDRKNLTPKERCFFETVADTPYAEMLARCSVPMVVSFTSFPRRIGCTVSIIENVCRQTRKADKILLYLAPEQFPGREADLPHALLDQINQGLATLHWVPDVRSHKKYHYVMREFPDSLIVTLDDDLTYPDDMLENLFHCYLCHPDKISAMRAHLAVADQSAGLLLPYSRWVKEYRGATYVPSPQLFFTSGAGTLFPPKVLHPLSLELDRAWSLCPYADDVWLNIMTLLGGSCAVLAVDDFTMKNMPGSQEEALQTINVGGNQNDLQYERVRCWLKEEFGTDVVWNALTAGDYAVRCKTVMDLSDQYLVLEETRKQVQTKLHRVWRDKVNREQDAARLRQERQKLQQELQELQQERQKLQQERQKLQQERQKLQQEQRLLRQECQSLRQERQKLQQALDAELRSFPLLRKVRNGFRLLRSKGVGYTLKLGTRKVLSRFLKK